MRQLYEQVRHASSHRRSGDTHHKAARPLHQCDRTCCRAPIADLGMPTPPSFRESNLYGSPIRDLGLSLSGTPLEPLVAEFEQELREKGIVRLTPKCYLS